MLKAFSLTGFKGICTASPLSKRVKVRWRVGKRARKSGKHSNNREIKQVKQTTPQKSVNNCRQMFSLREEVDFVCPERERGGACG